jgi:hypothetical protein
MTPDELRALAQNLDAYHTRAEHKIAASYLRACADAVPFAYGLKDNIGEIDHDLIGLKADCEFWTRAEGERQSGWTVVPLYAAPVVAQPLTDDLIRKDERERIAREVEQYGGAWDEVTQNFARMIRKVFIT